VGLWESLTGRSRSPAPKLDALFLVPSAAITLETALGLRPTGAGSVCFRAPDTAAYDEVQRDVLALLGADADAPSVEVTRDGYGFTWLTVSGDPTDTGGLCTDLHAVNTSLAEQGFAHGLLCTLVPFADDAGRRVGLVYLYKQGTFYPFAPAAAGGPGSLARDNLTEISVRDTLAPELPLEQDLQRWLALYGAPGL
jgi:hypothetical protein